NRFGQLGLSRQILHRLPSILDRTTIDEVPDVPIEAPEFFLDAEERLGVADGRFHFLSIADDSRILQERGDLATIEPRYFFRIEAGERLPIRFALAQDGDPGESRLCTLQDDELEQRPV